MELHGFLCGIDDVRGCTICYKYDLKYISVVAST